MTEKPPKGSYTIKYVCNILYDVMYPKITSKTCQTGDTAHDLELSRSCSATFEQLFGFGATFSPSSNFSDFEHFFLFE